MLLHLLQSMEKKVAQLEAAVAGMPTSDAVDSLRQEVRDLHGQIDGLKAALEDERGKGIESRAKLGIYGSIILIFITAIVGLATDIIKVDFSSNRAAEVSSE